MSRFQRTLKTWRTARRFSQLSLAAEANVSARHISFLETGRASPSRDMIGRLGEALQLPLAIRNQLLNEAGFATRYSSRNWGEEEMAPIRSAIAYTLAAHAPFPAFAIDKFWTIFKMNKPAERLFAVLGLEEGANLIDLIMTDRLASLIENWPEVAHHSALRLRTESAAHGGISEFDMAVAKLAKVPYSGKETPKAVVPTIYRLDEIRLSLFTTIAQFGTPEDLTLSDLKIEMFFPTDSETEAYLRSMDVSSR
jgi:transcriptional regulator with XRE-family HTH domain